MGGAERWVSEGSQLGVHQFYSPDESAINSQAVQAIVGLTLIHSLRMGVDAGVIVAASGTSPEEIYWFDQAELAALKLVTDGFYTERWRFEPYNGGVVLTTAYHDGPRRSVNLTLFCRARNSRLHLLISESLYYHGQFPNDQVLHINGDFRSRPTLSNGIETFEVAEADVEFQRITDDRVFVSLRLPTQGFAVADAELRFDPGLARVHAGLLHFRAETPSPSWIDVLAQNCI